MRVTIRNYHFPIYTFCGKYWFLEITQESQSFFLGTRKIKCVAKLSAETILNDLKQICPRFISKYGQRMLFSLNPTVVTVPESVTLAVRQFCSTRTRTFYGEGQSFLDNFMGENVTAVNHAIKEIESQLSSLPDEISCLSQVEQYLIEQKML